METQNIVTTDKVIGVNVRNFTNENIGDVKEIVLDKMSGQVCYVTLSVGGFLGVGAKNIAVPWHALKYDAAEGCFIINADKEKLKQAKELENGWNNWSDPTFGKNVNGYFGTDPYYKTTDVVRETPGYVQNTNSTRK